LQHMFQTGNYNERLTEKKPLFSVREDDNEMFHVKLGVLLLISCLNLLQDFCCSHWHQMKQDRQVDLRV
jgi:hypothetical protein